MPKTGLTLETMLSAEYKCISLFAENFAEIHRQLECLAQHGSNAKGRQTAHQLLIASGTTTFVITLHNIAKYSSIFEPVTKALQAVRLDMLGVKQHVDKLLSMFSDHRQNAEKCFAEDNGNSLDSSGIENSRICHMSPYLSHTNVVVKYSEQILVAPVRNIIAAPYTSLT